MKKLICKFFGHRWQLMGTDYDRKQLNKGKVKLTTAKCERCGVQVQGHFAKA